MNVVSHKCGLKWVWSQMNAVSNECGLKWLWSQMNVVSNECGLKFMWSQIHVVSNEKVSCECRLKWTGLKITWSQIKWSRLNKFKWMLSQMPWSQMNVVSNECGLKWMVSYELISIVMEPGVTVGNCRINGLLCFLRTNYYCMRGCSQQGLLHAFDRFYAACDQAGTKIST